MMIMMMMTMNSHDNNVSFISPSRSSKRITGLLKSFGGSDIPVTIMPGYFILMYKNTVISPFIIRLNVQSALEKIFI